MKRLIYALILGVLFYSNCSKTLKSQTLVKEEVYVISVNPVNPEIDPAFTGLSYEKSILSRPFFTVSNTALVRLFRNLGPGILRIGGNTVNETGWGGSGNAGSGSKSRSIRSGDIDNLAEFLRVAGWRAIYGLNGTTSSPENTAEEALYADSRLGDCLYGFEIGNEPDIYRHNGLKGRGFNFSEFTNCWLSYYSSITSKISHPVSFSGPAAAFDYREYTVPFAMELGKYINLLTHHYYVADGTSYPRPTIERLLSSLSPGNNVPLLRELESIKGAADSYVSGRYRMAEANSFYHGGAPGVSNNFGSALWALEFCFLLAQYGASGVNFHGGGDSPGYTPIANDRNGSVIQVRAEYYGILLFSLVARGRLMTIERTGQVSSLYIYAVSERDGSTAVILANNSRYETVDSALKFSESFAGASSMLMTAPAIDATNGMTLGGSPVNADGTWDPHPCVPLKLDNEGRSLDVCVQPGSAVWIRLTR